jgi:hypothetical protein
MIKGQNQEWRLCCPFTESDNITEQVRKGRLLRVQKLKKNMVKTFAHPLFTLTFAAPISSFYP